MFKGEIITGVKHNLLSLVASLGQRNFSNIYPILITCIKYHTGICSLI